MIKLFTLSGIPHLDAICEVAAKGTDSALRKGMEPPPPIHGKVRINLDVWEIDSFNETDGDEVVNVSLTNRISKRELTLSITSSYDTFRLAYELYLGRGFYDSDVDSQVTPLRPRSLLDLLGSKGGDNPKDITDLPFLDDGGDE